MVVVLGALREFQWFPLCCDVKSTDYLLVRLNSLVLLFLCCEAHTDCIIRSVISGPAEDSPSGDGKGGK
jgi:hypothetical protein